MATIILQQGDITTLALEHSVKSIAFPNISTGIYRFPKERAAQIAIDSVRSYTDGQEGIEEIYFVCFDQFNFTIYQQLLK